MSYQVIWDKNEGTKQGSLPNLTQGGTLETITILALYRDGSDVDLSAMTVTATMEDRDGDTTAVTGTLTGADGSFTWEFSAGDVGTAGRFSVIVTYTDGADSWNSEPAEMDVIPNPAAGAVQNPALVGIPAADAAWLATQSANGENVADKVDVAGDTMTGLLTLSAAPTADLHAATKKFAEDEAAAAQAAAQAASEPALGNPATSGHVLSSTDVGARSWIAQSGGGIGGSTGSTDNALLRADGTGGSTVQATGIVVDDSDNVEMLGRVTMPYDSGQTLYLAHEDSNGDVGVRQSVVGGNSFRVQMQNAVGSIDFRSGTLGASVMRLLSTGRTGFNESSPTGQVQVTSSGASIRPLILKAASGQSANIAEVWDNSNAVQFAIGPTGQLKTNQDAANTNTPSGATVHQLPIYNEAGTLLGYIPIYGSAW